MYQAEIVCGQIDTKLDFMRAMDRAFRFPPYFGENWDALWECMEDPYWINETHFHLKIVNSKLLFGKLKMDIVSFLAALEMELENLRSIGKIEISLEVQYE